MIGKILIFIDKNQFANAAYQERKDEVESLLTMLKKRSLSDQNQNPEFPWTKVLGITALITLPIFLIGLFILKISPGKKTKRKKIYYNK